MIVANDITGCSYIHVPGIKYVHCTLINVYQHFIYDFSFATHVFHMFQSHYDNYHYFNVNKNTEI